MLLSTAFAVPTLCSLEHSPRASPNRVEDEWKPINSLRKTVVQLLNRVTCGYSSNSPLYNFSSQKSLYVESNFREEERNPFRTGVPAKGFVSGVSPSLKTLKSGCLVNSFVAVRLQRSTGFFSNHVVWKKSLRFLRYFSQQSPLCLSIFRCSLSHPPISREKLRCPLVRDLVQRPVSDFPNGQT